MKLTRICFKVSSWGQENDSFGISYHAFGKELKINHDKTKCNRNKTRMRYTRKGSRLCAVSFANKGS